MSQYSASLTHFPKITYARYKKLAAYFSDLKNLWEAELPEMIAAGLEEEIASEFIHWREQNPTDKITERLYKEEITTVSLGEPNYPKLLTQISDPPITLFIRGTLPKQDLPTLAVVGTRRHTEYGKIACEKLVEPLARHGVVIVSGLAFGIDCIAHKATLRAGGITVAVLGGGVDKNHIAPANNAPIAEEIIKNGGAVISEYPPGFTPTKYSFPARNRIVAGLSLGTLVIEAPEESGALITARVALDYNREVMAVPHPIISHVGMGGNNLLKFGARIITSPEDIIEALNLQNLQKLVAAQLPLSQTPQEAEIIAALSREPKHIDEIIKQTGLPGQLVSSTLTLMEIQSKIRNLGGMKYTLLA